MALRLRVVAAVEAGGEHKEVARTFQVGEATVFRWIARKRRLGTVAPLPRGGGNPRSISQDDELLLRQFVEERSDRTLFELNGLLNKAGVVTSEASVSRALKRMNLPLKKSPSLPRRGSAKTS